MVVISISFFVSFEVAAVVEEPVETAAEAGEISGVPFKLLRKSVDWTNKGINRTKISTRSV